VPGALCSILVEPRVEVCLTTVFCHKFEFAQADPVCNEFRVCEVSEISKVQRVLVPVLYVLYVIAGRLLRDYGSVISLSRSRHRVSVFLERRGCCQFCSQTDAVS